MLLKGRNIFKKIGEFYIHMIVKVSTPLELEPSGSRATASQTVFQTILIGWDKSCDVLILYLSVTMSLIRHKLKTC